MTVEQFRERMATGEPIIGGSELHMEFHKYSQEALRITAEINGSYHTPGDHAGLQHEIDKSVAVTLHQQRVLFLHIAEIVILRLCCR